MDFQQMKFGFILQRDSGFQKLDSNAQYSKFDFEWFLAYSRIIFGICGIVN